MSADNKLYCCDMTVVQPSIWQNPCFSPKRIAVVSAITGRMDEWKVFPPQIGDDGNNIHVVHFNDMHVPQEYRKLNKRLQALYFKQQLFKVAPGYDVYIWIDGKIQVDSSNFVEQCLQALGDGELAVLKHGERDCVYDELRYIIQKTEQGSEYFVRRFAYRLDRLKKDLEYLKEEKYPEHAGLHDCSIMVWRETEETNALQDNWWNACSAFDLFDQTTIHLLTFLGNLQIRPVIFEPNTFHLVKHLRVR